MRRKIMQFVTALLALTLCLMSSAGAVEINPTIRVGLYYGDNALFSANLQNSVNSGYYFGYFTDSCDFVTLGSTDEIKISMLKTQNLYLQNGFYYDTQPGGDCSVIGCYHIQLPGSYAGFDEAKAAADALAGGFPAWIDGTYYVRTGAYPTKDAAVAAQQDLGIDGTTIVGTSCYGVSVAKTGTTKILFQFDGGVSLPFGVKPGLSDGTKPATWFKGYRYYGAFRYERLYGGNLTVVNIVALEDYVKGILPNEMSASWPLEALKAQAVCARTYAMISLNKHQKYHFDVCNSTDCQVYRGLNGANEVTDQAAEETRGIFARYNGTMAQTYYHSSDGGATEDIGNVWNPTTDMPYLTGVIDPYEATVASKVSQYRWTVRFTKSELTTLLRSKGYNCGSIADFHISEYTPTGNVLTITFVDANGKSWSFSKEKVRTLLGLRSMRYEVTGSSTYYVNDPSNTIDSVAGAYAINGSGSVAQVSGSQTPYVITSSGTNALSSSGGDTFTIIGYGWGHNVGLSQWGANAMAKLGYTYKDILKFYFTGIDLY